MAARKRRTTLNQKWRDKIRTSMLINRLDKLALAETERVQTAFGAQDRVKDPKCVMTKSQIEAAKILLAKVAPDLNKTEIAGDPDAPLNVKNRIDLSGLNAEELATLEGIAGKLTRKTSSSD